MKWFSKVTNSFEEGLKELAELSFSADQALRFHNGQLPENEDEAVKNLTSNVMSDRQAGNGADWGRCHLIVNSLHVEYRTSGGLRFGWEPVLGASYRDEFEGKYVFFITHPEADETQAAPSESTLRQSCGERGWIEQDYELIALTGHEKV